VNGDKFLLDTNILLYLTGKKIDTDNLPTGEFYISFVTELEILSYPSITQEEEKDIEKLLMEIPVIELNKEIKKHAVEFRRKYNLKLPDAIIAATAFELGATLITNDKRFLSIAEIKVKSIEL